MTFPMRSQFVVPGGPGLLSELSALRRDRPQQPAGCHSTSETTPAFVANWNSSRSSYGRKGQVLHSMERWGELQCSCVSWLQARSEVHRVYEANADGALVNWIVSIVVEKGWIQHLSNEQESRKLPNLRPSRSMLNWSRFGEAKIWADRIVSFAVAGVQPIAVQHNWSLCEPWNGYCMLFQGALPVLPLTWSFNSALGAACSCTTLTVYESSLQCITFDTFWRYWILSVLHFPFFFGRSFQLPILVRCPEAFSLLLPFLRANRSIRQVRRHVSNGQVDSALASEAISLAARAWHRYSGETETIKNH